MRGRDGGRGGEREREGGREREREGGRKGGREGEREGALHFPMRDRPPAGSLANQPGPSPQRQAQAPALLGYSVAQGVTAAGLTCDLDGLAS